MLTVRQKIKKCINARKGGGKDPFRCGHDYCQQCCQPKTQWLQSEAQEFMKGANDPKFTTILLKPRRTLSDMIRDTAQALFTLARLNVDCIGSMEIGTPNGEHNWSQYAQCVGYIPALHKGIAHLHVLTRSSYDDVLRLPFRKNYQVKEVDVGKGKHGKNKTFSQNVDYLIHYPRIHDSCNEFYYNELNHGDEQLAFMVLNGSTYLSGKQSGERVWHKVIEESDIVGFSVGKDVNEGDGGCGEGGRGESRRIGRIIRSIRTVDTRENTYSQSNIITLTQKEFIKDIEEEKRTERHTLSNKAIRLANKLKKEFEEESNSEEPVEDDCKSRMQKFLGQEKTEKAIADEIKHRERELAQQSRSIDIFINKQRRAYYAGLRK